MTQVLRDPLADLLGEPVPVWEDGTVDVLPDDEYWPVYMVFATEQDARAHASSRVRRGEGAIVRDPYPSSLAESFDCARFYKCATLEVCDGNGAVLEVYPV